MGLTQEEIDERKAAEAAKAVENGPFVNAKIEILVPLDGVTVNSTPQEKLDAAVSAYDSLALDPDLGAVVSAQDSE